MLSRAFLRSSSLLARQTAFIGKQQCLAPIGLRGIKLGMAIRSDKLVGIADEDDNVDKETLLEQQRVADIEMEKQHLKERAAAHGLTLVDAKDGICTAPDADGTGRCNLVVNATGLLCAKHTSILQTFGVNDELDLNPVPAELSGEL
eukprot:g52250.t1